MKSLITFTAIAGAALLGTAGCSQSSANQPAGESETKVAAQSETAPAAAAEVTDTDVAEPIGDPSPESEVSEAKVEAVPDEFKDLPVNDNGEVTLSDEEWKKRLEEDRYYVLREEGTERAFSNALWDNKKEGLYRCAGCGQALFTSDTKYKSGTGWPSFWAPIDDGAVETRIDRRFFVLPRTEVHCKRCKGHLGHVFSDGPKPTGQRYCMNSAAMIFEATAGDSSDTKTEDEKSESE